MSDPETQECSHGDVQLGGLPSFLDSAPLEYNVVLIFLAPTETLLLSLS